MKEIKANHDNRDRIICVSELGKHKFYFQPVGTKERIWLFNTKSFSRTVFAFFRKYGRNLDDIGFSMTLREIYALGNVNNVKINRIMNRIPAQVEYVLREREEFVETPCVTAKVHYRNKDFYRTD